MSIFNDLSIPTASATAFLVQAEAARDSAQAAASSMPARSGRKSASAQYLARVPDASLFRDAPQAVRLIERLADAGLFDDLAVALPSGGAYALDSGVATAYNAAGSLDATGTSGNRPALDASGGMVFNGTSDFLRIGDGDTLDESAFTISLMMRVDGHPQTHSQVISRGQPSGTSVGGWALVVNTSNRARFIFRDASQAALLSPWFSLPQQAEHRLTAVYEQGVGIRVYLNGALASQLDTESAIGVAAGSVPILLGAGWTGGTQRFQGMMRDVLVWDRALTDQECRDLPAVLQPDADVPALLQPMDFRLDGVLDTSRSPLWLPASARPALQPIGGTPVFDANGVVLNTGRALNYNLPRAVQTFGVGFTFYPDWDFAGALGDGSSNPPVSTPRFMELIAPTASGDTPEQSPRCFLRYVANGLSLNFEGFAATTVQYARLGWQQGDKVECYILSEPGNISVFIKTYRPREGVKVDVLSVTPPADFRAQRIVMATPASANSPAASYSRVRIDVPPYQMPNPDSYFGLNIQDEPLLVVNIDDGPSTDYTIAAPIMLERGLRGTSYIITNSVGGSYDPGDEPGGNTMSWGQILELADKGWDIQCHTDTHPDLTSLTEQQVRDQFEAVDAAFSANGLPRPTCHAYPYGGVNQSVRNITSEYRRMARSVNFSLDTFSPAHYAMSTIAPNFEDIEVTKADIQRAIRNRAIINIIFHRLDQEGREAWFTEFADYIAENIKVVTMNQLLDRLGPRNAQGYYLG